MTVKESFGLEVFIAFELSFAKKFHCKVELLYTLQYYTTLYIRYIIHIYNILKELFYIAFLAIQPICNL